MTFPSRFPTTPDRLRSTTSLRAGLALLLAAGLVGCHQKQFDPEPVPRSVGPAEEAAQGPPLFEEVTEKSGLRFTYRNGEEAGHLAILETLGGGVALLDFDGDGLLDVYVPGGGHFRGTEILGHPGKLYRNLGNWKFQDVTEAVGLAGPVFYSHGAAACDYDRDGWPDLLVSGWGRVALYHNEPDGRGGRRFVDVTAKAGLGQGFTWATSAAWGDLDGDGFPDLYVCQYCDWSFANHPTDCTYNGGARDICPPKRFKPLPHRLFRNNGNGTFTDVSERCCVDREGKVTGLRRDGHGLAVLAVDVNGDGKPDLYVANDTDDKFLYLNVSTRGELRLKEVGLDAGAACDERGLPNGSMGLDAGDYNRSGRPALFVTNYENELDALYRNDCVRDKVLFQYSTQAAGIGVLGTRSVGWGTGFVDVENRGWEDLVIINGHILQHPPPRSPLRQMPALLRNVGGKFQVITPQGGPYFQTPHRGRGVAPGDLDNDGRTDLVISHVGEPVAVLRNVAQNDNRWLGVELVGKGKRDVVGARLTLEVGDQKLTKFAKGGGSYASSPDRRHLFGLGTQGEVGALTVSWPRGQAQTWKGLAPGRSWRLTEGEHMPEEIKPRR
jgi:hypothetical protein